MGVDGKVFLASNNLTIMPATCNQQALTAVGATPPTTWSAVLSLCATAKAKGKVAYALGGLSGGNQLPAIEGKAVSGTTSQTAAFPATDTASATYLPVGLGAGYGVKAKSKNVDPHKSCSQALPRPARSSPSWIMPTTNSPHTLDQVGGAKPSAAAHRTASRSHTSTIEAGIDDDDQGSTRG